jgi:hypothetical protein
VQEALGDLWAEGLKERLTARDTAAAELTEARAAAPEQLPSVQTLRSAWERMNVLERRELMSKRFHAISLSRDGALVVWPAGSTVELPSRGYGQARDLGPFPAAPDGAGALAL